MLVVQALLALAAAGLVLTSVQVFLVRRLRRPAGPFVPGPRERATNASRPDASSTRPFVSILKPLSGDEADLEENLASFAALEGLDYEVILSVADPHDPALASARRAMARFPEAPFSIVIGGVRPGTIPNPKVERLVAAAARARGEIFLISDSNVRVGPRDVARTIAAFDDPSVGCVSNIFTGAGERSAAALVESLHLLTFVVPGNALAAAGGVPCVVGKSMALTRRALEAIGGFAPFGDVLAEDQALGLAVSAAGFRVVLSPVVVRNVLGRRTLRQALARQVRWGKIRYSFSKATFLGELLLNPFGVAFTAWALAAAGDPASAPLAGAVASAAAVLRIAQALLLGHLTGAHVGATALVLMPVKDVLQLVTQAAPLVSREVSWHGHRARLGPGTRLVPSRHPA